jgi:hypothetical protein
MCFGDAASYRVYVYMLYLLQGGRPAGMQQIQHIHIQTICCRITETFNKIINFLTYNFSKEQNVLPEDDLRIETCRGILSVLM